MKNKKFLMKVLGIILPIAVVAVAIISALSEQGSAYHTESTGYTEYSFECKNGSSAKFNEDGSFEISAPEGYIWKSGISDDRALQLSQNSDWQAYMKSLIAVSYYDSALSVYQLKTVYSSSNSANIITETRADGCHYKIVFPDIMISVEVDITWRNGFLSVKIPYEKIIENGSFKLQTIEILPFFGAEDSKTDGYIVYPDGCGALMNYAMLQNRAANLRKGTLKIYGSSGIDSDSGAALPVFGIKNGNSAVLAAVTTGAAECDINMSPEGTVVALNRIAFSMNYRYCYDIPESDISSADAEGTATKADKIITNQDFEAVYLFLENEKANYSGMAGIYREFLQKNQMLKKSEQNSALSLALIMGESEKQLENDEERNMATIKDIAARAGVTATTVSRVINNRGYISEETRKKVTQAMQEMNYQPNELARSLAKAHSNTIGVIVPHISHPFFSKMISALESAAAKRGYKILLCNSKDQPEKETEYLDMFISNRVTGVVMASRDVQIEKFHDLKIPIVNFEREENTEAITIQCDNEQGGALAASHLADCGCRHLLHFGGIVGRDMPADRRADGFLRVCRERGIEGEVLLSDRLSYGSMHYESYIEKGLLEHPETDGIFASSDLIAAQVLQRLYAMGKRVPEDIKVVGFDDTVIAGITTPSITTIHQPIEEMSELSIAYIDRRRKGEMVPNVTTMPVSLVVRGSA